MNFIAIDFETANGKRSSACSLGLVHVKNGKIVETRDWLISPPEMYFHPINVSIHGITPDNVDDQPSFNFIWEEVEDYIHDRMVIAHNVGFDMSVLCACLKAYRIPKPDFDYMCTVQISKNIWPGMPNHKLNTMAHLFDIPLKHHNALEDAIACAKIAIKACEVTNTGSLIELASEIKVTPGRFSKELFKSSGKFK